MKNYLTLLLLAFFITCISCQKKDVDTVQQDQLTLQINKPAAAQVFRQNDTVFIVAKTSYVSELHGYALMLTDTVSKTTYLDIAEHLHGSSFDIDTFWINTANPGAELQLKLTAEIDHDGHEKSETVNFKSQL